MGGFVDELCINGIFVGKQGKHLLEFAIIKSVCDGVVEKKQRLDRLEFVIIKSFCNGVVVGKHG
jgi:hypothetical protein